MQYLAQTRAKIGIFKNAEIIDNDTDFWTFLCKVSIFWEQYIFKNTLWLRFPVILLSDLGGHMKLREI